MDERTILTLLRSAIAAALIVFASNDRLRRSLVQALGDVEDTLGVPRTVPHRDDRRAARVPLAK